MHRAMVSRDLPYIGSCQLTSGHQPNRPSSIEARTIEDHRAISHRMLEPRCLCPMMDPTRLNFIEAAIYVQPLGQGEPAEDFNDRNHMA
jgi:hypothetical protein